MPGSHREPRKRGSEAGSQIYATLGALALLLALVGGLIALGVLRPVAGSVIPPPATPAPGSVTAWDTGLSTSASTEGCLEPPSVIWKPDNTGVNAYPDASLSLELAGCTTLMVTSGHLVGPDGQECGYEADQVCVVLIRANTRGQRSE